MRGMSILTQGRIAVAQSCSRAGDVEGNTGEHVRLAERAAARGASLVLFPELSLTGYELETASDAAFTLDDERLAPLLETAERCDTTLIVGAPVRDSGLLYIGALILGPDGSVELYTKQRLGVVPPEAAPEGGAPPAEETLFTAGVRDPEVRAGAVRARIAICADIGDPAHVARAAENDANLYLASMLVTPSDYEADAARLGAYARRHGLAVALANHGAPTGGLDSAGGSAIWDSDGGSLVRLPPVGAGVGGVAEGRAYVSMLEPEVAGWEG